MELKQEQAFKAWQEKQLLIVPYGIETVRRSHKNYTKNLLIVPYGIETGARASPNGQPEHF